MLEEQVRFPDPMRLLDKGMHKGTRVFELEADFRFHSSWGTILVPKGFHTDGYSVPTALHSYCNPFAKGMQGSLAHDLLYSVESPYKFTRKDADDIFLEGMKVCGVRFTKRMMIYSAVRSCGWMFYKKK